METNQEETTNDPYKLLGIDDKATPDDIRKAFKVLGSPFLRKID